MDPPHFDVSLDRHNSAAGALQLVKMVRPAWGAKGQELVTKHFTDGITNVLVGVRLAEDKRAEDMLLVRIHGNNTELIIDRDREIQTIRMLERARCCPPLYCRFTNGICYGFVPGKPVDRESVREAHVMPLIVQAMVKFHSVDAECGGDTSSSSEPVLFTTMETWLQKLPTAFEDSAKQAGFDKLYTKLNIAEELSRLKPVLQRHAAPNVFCHNDLLLGNVIFDSDKDCVSFIDFEYGGFNPRSYDIANHFCEYPGTEDVNYDLFPSREYQLQWLRLYLVETARAKGLPNVDPSEADVERMYVEVSQFVLASHMFWGIWAILQAANSEIAFDYMGYAHVRFDEYLRRKDAALALSVPAAAVS